MCGARCVIVDANANCYAATIERTARGQRGHRARRRKDQRIVLGRKVIRVIALFELSTIFGRCPARKLPKRHAERAGLGIADGQPDVRDRDCLIGQEQFGLLHSPLYVIPMRRNPERLFEGPTEMMLT